MLLTKMLPVEKLGIGMYVAQLDRPWLETPFLFQGFYIRDDDEIADLKKHCKHVYVSRESLTAEQAELDSPIGEVPPPEEIVDKKDAHIDLLFEVDKAEGHNGEVEQTNIVYEETTSLKEESRTAVSAYEQAMHTVHGVMQNLQKSGSLDITQLEMAITPMVNSVLRNPAALACLMRMQKKGNYLYRHSLASTVWAAILGRQIGLSRDDLNVISVGAMLLDVGKTQLPDDLLDKPGKLTDDERQLVRQHVQFGLDILEKAGGVDTRVQEMVAHHHERYNGTGYPSKLKGNSIPVFGRIAGIVDAYDAMITRRPYAKLQSSYDALRTLRKLADVEFQAEIVEQFTRAIGAFPTGTLVELNTREIAIVTKQNRIRRLRPEVMIIMSAEKQLLEQFRIVDLNEETIAEGGTLSLWIERGLPPGVYGIDPTEFYLN